MSQDLAGVVLGSYRVIDELASGGMGTVYRARHELLGRPAAIKVLRADLGANQELVERFFNEARAATAIRHPGIIEAFDYGHAPDGRAYLVMELLEGEPLSKRIAARGRMPEVEAAQIARGIASALTAAHARGIVHRDLKPDNVFLVPDPDVPGGERPKVLDFGIAKLADPRGVPTSATQTAAGALMGTPLYMSPEQARAAGEIDMRADLYSLGCMLYEMVVGEPPFMAAGPGEIIAMQLFTKPVPPRERGVAIAEELEQIIMRCLEKSPAQRYQLASELQDDLAAFSGATTLRGEVYVLPRKRRSLLLPLLVSLAAASAIGAAVVVATTGREASGLRPRASGSGSEPEARSPKPEVSLAELLGKLSRGWTAEAARSDPGGAPSETSDGQCVGRRGGTSR